MHQPDQADLLTSVDVAEMYGVDSKTVVRWADAGKLPHFKTPGGRYRFRRAEVQPTEEAAS